jgi:high-affinity Fe2+/Pb2+ permease
MLVERKRDIELPNNPSKSSKEVDAMVSWIGMMKVAGIMLVVGLVLWLLYISNICLAIFVGIVLFVGWWMFIRYAEYEFQPDKP